MGDVLLNQCAPALIRRLSLDPVELLAGTVQRRITVDRVARGARGNRTSEEWEIAWNGLSHFDLNYLTRLSYTVNEEVITEWAAIGVMALLIHELEGLAIQTVLQKGSGPDYVVVPEWGGQAIHVEVSGIRQARSVSVESSRLAEKTGQVLRSRASGFVSVTVFQCGEENTVRSYLHFVTARRGRKGSKKR